jgi:hypothetical protein
VNELMTDGTFVGPLLSRSPLLETFNAGYCAITSIPSNAFAMGCGRLDKLLLEGNGLESIPSTLGPTTCPTLSVLHLHCTFPFAPQKLCRA